MHGEKNIEKYEQMKWSYVYQLEPLKERKELGIEKIFEAKMIEKFPNLMKFIIPQIQETQ